MAIAASEVRSQELPAFPSWGPICCKKQMHDMVRRAILRSDGSVVYCCVWHCLICGRLLL